MIRLHRDERGSLPMALLAAIVSGGLIVVLVAGVLASEQSVRHDRDFVNAFHQADRGVQWAFQELEEMNQADTFLTQPANTVVSNSEGSSTDGYEVEATYDGAGVWEVRAKGMEGDNERWVEASISRAPRFFLAAFGKVIVGTSGSNGAKSYDQDGNYPTGKGAVGSNGDVEILGNTEVDEVFLYGPDAECTQTQSNCEELADADKVQSHPDPFVLETDFITEALNDNTVCPNVTSFDTSIQGTTLGYDSAPVHRVQDGRKQAVYCFSSMRVDGELNLDVAADEEIVIYMSGPLETTNSTKVNCSHCIHRDPEATIALEPPRSSALQIYSVGSEVAFGNHNVFAGAVYAPGASCYGSPSNAQVDVYGSMVCSTLGNQGGWDFYFDEDLLNISSTQLEIEGFREEVGGTTSFD